MKKIYSRVSPKELLHLIYPLNNNDQTERVNVAPEDEYLQLAVLKMNKGRTFMPHKHIIKEKITDIAQESWIVFRGAVECIFYDLDDTIITKEIIRAGDISMTFRGGHNYRIIEDNTIVYEYKTGPYLGVEFDKKFIK